MSCSPGPLRSVLAHFKATAKGFPLRTINFVHNTELEVTTKEGVAAATVGGAVAQVEST